MDAATAEQKEAHSIYEKLSKKKQLDTIDSNTKKLALEYRAIKRANRTEEQKQAKLKQDNSYYHNNHEKCLKYFKEKRETEEYKQRMKEYRVSDAGKKSARITQWKQSGVICDDYDALYNKWKTTTHCEECNVELCEGNNGINKKTLDHDHETGVFRNIICHRCNVNRGLVDNNIVAMTKEQISEQRKQHYKANAERIKAARMKYYYDKKLKNN
jgi:hypothetical protein